MKDDEIGVREVMDVDDVVSVLVPETFDVVLVAVDDEESSEVIKDAELVVRDVSVGDPDRERSDGDGLFGKRVARGLEFARGTRWGHVRGSGSLMVIPPNVRDT